METSFFLIVLQIEQWLSAKKNNTQWIIWINMDNRCNKVRIKWHIAYEMCNAYQLVWKCKRNSAHYLDIIRILAVKVTIQYKRFSIYFMIYRINYQNFSILYIYTPLTQIASALILFIIISVYIGTYIQPCRI